MKKSRIALEVMLVVALLFGVAFVQAMGTEATEAGILSNRDRTLEYISQTHDIPEEQMTIINEGEANYPLTNQKLYCAKIMDKKSGEVYGLYIDEDGDFVDIKTIEDKEEAAHFKRYGKLEPELYERLQDMRSDEEIKVGIWLTSGNMNEPKPDGGEISEEVESEMLTSKRSAYALKEKPLMDLLSAKGFEITYACQYAPLIFAELPNDAIMELSNRPDVDAIYISRTYEPELNSAAPTEKANVVWNRGITGTGIKVAVVEDGGIKFANPYLADGSYFNSANPNIQSHETAIAGIIESTHSTYKGIAYGAPALLSANAQTLDDDDIISATEWAINNGARILSNSWGSDTNLQLSSMDRYLDHVVWSNYRTVVKSAGNVYNSPNYNVTSPGLGYNMITVGAIDDKDTSSWSDDIMATYSCYKDPISPHNDREKPEVVAVGSRMRSTKTSWPWTGYIGSGTSYAAPSVAGEAALLMQRESWLKYWPESVKAVSMASAVHNIEGSSRLSEKDGAGAIDCSKADDTARYDRVYGNTLYEDDFPKWYSFSVSSGQKVRAVVCWDSHPDSSHPPSTDPLESDLDLRIYDPSGNYVTGSASWDNNYEIVEFTASTSGTYKAKVNAYRFDGTYEYVGFAYCFV